MRGTTTREPYSPAESLPGDGSPNRSVVVSWSLSNDNATAARAPPCQTFGFSERPALTLLTIPRHFSSGHCHGSVVFGSLAVRSRTEDAQPLARFGEHYRAYRQRTGGFLPRLDQTARRE